MPLIEEKQEVIAECIIDGKVMPYDACASSMPLESAIEAYKGKYDYIGSSYEYRINGVDCTSNVLYHFFSKTKDN
jgi:hypothetical protein